MDRILNAPFDLLIRAQAGITESPVHRPRFDPLSTIQHLVSPGLHS